MKKIFSLEEAIFYLKKDKLVILKTDTVYGIMASFSKKNEERINKFKKSPVDKKISVIFPNIDMIIENISDLSFEKLDFMKSLLPGKYTFLVNLKKEFAKSYGFLRTDFGVRVTSFAPLQKIVSEVGLLLASSCNFSGEEICTTSKMIVDTFNDYDVYFWNLGDSLHETSTIYDLRGDITLVR